MSGKNKPQSHRRVQLPANKNIGQHFLTDPHIIERIVDAIDVDNALVNNESLLEIGPGLGAITMPILAQAQKLTAIELDRRVIAILREKAEKLGELTLIQQDILQTDIQQLLHTQKKWRVFGNLPYNISTPILFKLANIDNINHMIFMLQKEVVQRMDAVAGESSYGRLSVMLALHHDIYPLFDVPPAAFNPPPKVMSAMVAMTRLEKPRWQVDNESLFAEVVKQAFAMRRKTLRNNLKTLIDDKSLQTLDIDPGLRAERLTGNDFAKISNFLSNPK